MTPYKKNETGHYKSNITCTKKIMNNKRPYELQRKEFVN